MIYPHAPQNRRSEAKVILKDLVGKYKVGVVAIGNGTACRETEELIAEIIAEGTQFSQAGTEPATAELSGTHSPEPEQPASSSPAEQPGPGEAESATPAEDSGLRLRQHGVPWPSPDAEPGPMPNLRRMLSLRRLCKTHPSPHSLPSTTLSRPSPLPSSTRLQVWNRKRPGTRNRHMNLNMRGR